MNIFENYGGDDATIFKFKLFKYHFDDDICKEICVPKSSMSIIFTNV